MKYNVAIYANVLSRSMSGMRNKCRGCTVGSLMRTKRVDMSNERRHTTETKRKEEEKGMKKEGMEGEKGRVGEKCWASF